MSYRISMCFYCKRYYADKDGYIDEAGNRHRYCAAYPDGKGIPEAVERSGHFNPKPGDHGLQFEPSEFCDDDRLNWYHEIFAKEDERYANYSSRSRRRFS